MCVCVRISLSLSLSLSLSIDLSIYIHHIYTRIYIHTHIHTYIYARYLVWSGVGKGVTGHEAQADYVQSTARELVCEGGGGVRKTEKHCTHLNNRKDTTQTQARIIPSDS